MDCPTCSSTAVKVIETRICTNGTRRRRYRCLACDNRWSVWDGDRPIKGGTGLQRPLGKRKDRLTPEHIRLALTKTWLNNRQIAAIIDCSAEAVRQIRCGMIHGAILPDLIRPKAERQQPATDGPNCLNCQEWRDGRCSFSFPDPLLEGLTFAAECNLYEPRVQAADVSS